MRVCQRPICRKPTRADDNSTAVMPCNRREGHEGACTPPPKRQRLWFKWQA